MPTIQPCDLPPGALLHKYRAQGGAYTDCYVTQVAWRVSQSEYVEAFYTTAVFKLERWLLRWLVSRPSTDAEARQLASGALDSFAAWEVEEQTADQLLLCDLRGDTRSWLMAVPIENDDHAKGTRLYFGSAVVPVVSARSRKTTLGFAYRSLLGFHKLYSRVLLRAARSRLARRQPDVP